MRKNEYFSNCYKVILTNKSFHFTISFLEYILTLMVQSIIFYRKTNYQNNNEAYLKYFHVLIKKLIDLAPLSIKIIFIIMIYALIVIYYLIYNQYSFKQKCIFHSIIINAFEIFIFRLFFIVICYIVFSGHNSFVLMICIVISIPIFAIILNNFNLNHLHYFSPHFVTYPYDYYSSFIDNIHLFEKILLCISMQSPNNNFNDFLYIAVIILQFANFFFSVYIFIFKSYYIMNNIFLGKARFSFVLSTFLVSVLMIILGKNNSNNFSFILIILNIFIMFFIIISIFYNPYKYVFFDTNDNIQNLYFYFFIIDHHKNESFLLEETLQNHYSLCKKCDLCKKLKNHLKKNINYKNIYKILYKDIGMLSKITNELIHILLLKGKKAIKNNSYFLINYIYCYYIHYSRKNYVLSSNIKIIYEIINEENKNILENHILSTEQILLINEFLSKSQKLLNEIQEVVIENINQRQIKKIFSINKSILDLKDKKFQNKVFYNKKEGIINFIKHISICTLIYEEIFNITLSNGQISLKENQLFLESLSNKNNEMNQIIIQLDLLKFENKIIYIIGEYAKYKNKSLCQLFPNIFRNKQLLIIKTKITNSKFYINTPDEEKKSILNIKKDSESQFIELKFIIYDNEEKEKQKVFKLINLKLNLIYPLEPTKKILLSGIYSIENNIVISIDKSSKEKKLEIIINLGTEKEEEIKNFSFINTNYLIKYKKNEKYYNNKKLIFINTYFINPNIYNIYYIYHREKQKTHKEENIQNGTDNKSKSKNFYGNDSCRNNDIYGISDGNQNIFFIQSTTASSSTFVQASNDKKNYKKRNKNSKKNNKSKNSFRKYQFCLVIISILVLLLQILSYKLIFNFNVYIDNQDSLLAMFKNYFGLYNVLFGSILSLACLSNETRGEICFSTSRLFEQYNNNINDLSISQFFFQQNYIMSIRISKVKQQIIEILADSNEPSLDDLLNSKIPIYYLNQNISKTEIKLNFQIQPTSFLDVLDYMTTGFLVMTSKIENINEIVYIINRKNPFTHVRLTSELSQYQTYFYYFIFNYQIFIKRFDAIIGQLIAKNVQLFYTNIKYANIIISINLVFYLLLHFIIYIYLHKYYNLIMDLIEGIENKMNLKNENISVREMFLEKIEKLLIIISLYKQDIYQAIVDLNFIYDNYKKFIDQKNKEMAKYLKKEKYSVDSGANTTLNQKKNKKAKIKYLINIPENKMYLYYILITFIISLIINASLAYLWGSYLIIYNRIHVLIKSHGNLSNDAYKLINHYQLMIFNNITVEDINIIEGYSRTGKDLFSNIYTDIQAIYDAKKSMNRLSQYNLDKIESYYNFTCETFFEFLFKNNIGFKSVNPNYKGFLIYICESSKVFNSNNYKQIFSALFEKFQNGINKINNRSYDGLINSMHNEEYDKIIVCFVAVYKYLFEILGEQIQRKSYQKITSFGSNYTNLTFAIYYISTFTFILLIIFEYIWNINSNYNKLHELKKVFKICNKKE